jgi:hypothetical protein
MPRYIDLDDAIKHLRGACIAKYPLSFSCGIFASADEISKLPTADVAEVVRCKDCKFWTPMDNGISWHHKGRTDGECEKLWQLHCAERHLTQQDHFCGYGERKE